MNKFGLGLDLTRIKKNIFLPKLSILFREGIFLIHSLCGSPEGAYKAIRNSCKDFMIPFLRLQHFKCF